MTELIHTKKNCTATDLCLGGENGLFCGNCSAGIRKVKMNPEDYQTIYTAEGARELAVDWQVWQQDHEMSLGELAEWQALFRTLARKFNLRDEFEENGII